MFEGITDYEELAQSLWAGDQDTYDFVWREIRDPLFAFLRVRKGLSVEDAEDIVSLVWVRIRSSCCKTYDPSVATIDRWLVAIAANLAVDLLDEKRDSTSIDDVDPRLLSSEPTIESEAFTNVDDEEEGGDGRVELLEKAKRYARPTDLEAISLRYTHECTYSRMGRILGISTPAAGMRVIRAVHRLRDEVKRLQSNELRRKNKKPDEEDSS
jgi:RNA polymerase sigma factor (sigma-70 family)